MLLLQRLLLVRGQGHEPARIYLSSPGKELRSDCEGSHLGGMIKKEEKRKSIEVRYLVLGSHNQY